MPPKKDPKQAAKTAADNDLSDVSLLPQLNEFVFITLYAFKYRLSQQKVEEALLGELDLASQPTAQDPEFADAIKRNKVIQMKDLVENAESRGYMTAAEIQEGTDQVKIQQVLARSCNDLLVGIQVPLRREKA